MLVKCQLPKKSLSKTDPNLQWISEILLSVRTNTRGGGATVSSGLLRRHPVQGNRDKTNYYKTKLLYNNKGKINNNN